VYVIEHDYRCNEFLCAFALGDVAGIPACCGARFAPPAVRFIVIDWLTFSRAQVKPSEIYFSHSKIRPIFTGNGKSLQQTYEELVDGRTTLNDMPILRVWYDG
jgi:hypothetical protein